MKEDEVIGWKVPPKNIQCKNCFNSSDNPFSHNCLKYRFKPNSVFYDGKECPKFEYIEDEEDEEE